MVMLCWLMVLYNHLEKYEFVSWKDLIIPYIMENKRRLKPPTRVIILRVPTGLEPQLSPRFFEWNHVGTTS